METNKNIVKITNRRVQFYKKALKIEEDILNVQRKMNQLGKQASVLLGYDVTAELTAASEIEFRRNDVDDFTTMTVMDVVNQINS